MKKAEKAGLISRHVSADGTLVRANASYKSFAPIEVVISSEEYKSGLRSSDKEENDDEQPPDDPCNLTAVSAPRSAATAPIVPIATPIVGSCPRDRRGLARTPATR